MALRFSKCVFELPEKIWNWSRFFPEKKMSRQKYFSENLEKHIFFRFFRRPKKKGHHLFKVITSSVSCLLGSKNNPKNFFHTDGSYLLGE